MRSKLKYLGLTAVLAAAVASSTPPEANAALPNWYCLGRYGDCREAGSSEALCWANYEGCMCATDGIGCLV